MGDVAVPGINDLGFTSRRRGDDTVLILRHGRPVVTVGGAQASAFLARAEGGDPAAIQRLIARVTGNYKRGNERAAGRHPRNRR